MAVAGKTDPLISESPSRVRAYVFPHVISMSCECVCQAKQTDMLCRHRRLPCRLPRGIHGCASGLQAAAASVLRCKAIQQRWCAWEAGGAEHGLGGAPGRVWRAAPGAAVGADAHGARVLVGLGGCLR